MNNSYFKLIRNVIEGINFCHEKGLGFGCNFSFRDVFCDVKFFN